MSEEKLHYALGSHIGLMMPYRHLALSAMASLAFAIVVGGISFELVLLSVAMFTILAGAQNSLNSYTDVEADRISWPNRPLPCGRISLGRALYFSLALFAAGILLFIITLVFAFKPLLLAVMAADILLRIFYSMQPRLKRFSLIGNLIATSFILFFPFIWITVLSSNAKSFPLTAFGFLFVNSVATLAVADFITIDGDRAIGDQTIPIVLGRKYGSTLIGLIYLIGLILLFLSVNLVKSTLITCILFLLQLGLIINSVLISKSNTPVSVIYRINGLTCLAIGILTILAVA